jgi:N-glycosylase/DNA lyase
MHSLKNLTIEYSKKKKQIKERLKKFETIGRGSTKELFPELCFCLLTPQSNAVSCDRAITALKKKGLLLKGTTGEIRKILKSRTRFHNKKADYIVLARSCFDKNILKSENKFMIRDWFAKNIKGLGYKEASHFLRNIGQGSGIAILDRHILKNLKYYGVIKKIPASLTPKNYLVIEKKVLDFAKRMKIPAEELDLLFWSKETGVIFK